MGLNETPSSARIHISFFGRRNAGKSSLVNAVTGQNLCVVSDIEGTTTDPVSKSMELLPLGAVVITDTAGIDDSGKLGDLRVQKTKQIIDKTDIAILVSDIQKGIGDYEKELISIFESKNIPYITVFNKCDDGKDKVGALCVSAKTGYNIERLKNEISHIRPQTNEMHLVSDFISKGDIVVFVIPIDESAPKGRLILPQQQAIRDVLDSGAAAIAVGVVELADILKKITPDLVVTDSQAFAEVSTIVPNEIPLTSFSILMARIKGLLKPAVRGAYVLDSLRDGDTILIAEGCTHHRQCNDIGTVKLPKLIKKHTNAEINFEFSSGGDFPEDLNRYALIVHCGGCMLNDRQMISRVNRAEFSGIPITNYGTAIAHMNSILSRSLEILGPELFEKDA